ncbi:hypothetical protein CUJ89_17035 [Burkholderia pyrrocinia]|uniref:Uncharacterized protein n=1 Tax=Burkholderia pyrrocinia TaxID=60550 RepID=A0A2Z5MXJ1_BURPY|nr:hypothetical protein CUJ89_17035 [Burkholderia pyrrocinia]
MSCVARRPTRLLAIECPAKKPNVTHAMPDAIAAPGGFGGQSYSTGYDGGIRPCKRTRDAVVDWRHSTNSRHFACFFFFSRFDKP